jgi:1,4-dihydroxy-2-naphthoyl-CoA hydrolase
MSGKAMSHSSQEDDPGQTSADVNPIDVRSSDLVQLLDMRVDESGPTHISGSSAADQRHHQPWGLVHGGLYATAIETFATIGAYEAVKNRGQQAVGISNATDFLRPHVSGRLRVLATAIHQGRTQQLWQVEIRRPDDDRLIARGQVRLQNVDESGWSGSGKAT